MWSDTNLRIKPWKSAKVETFPKHCNIFCKYMHLRLYGLKRHTQLEVWFGAMTVGPCTSKGLYVLETTCFKYDVCLNKNQLSDYDIILGACHLSGAHLEEKAVTGNSRLTVSQRQGPSCFFFVPPSCVSPSLSWTWKSIWAFNIYRKGRGQSVTFLFWNFSGSKKIWYQKVLVSVSKKVDF